MRRVNICNLGKLLFAAGVLILFFLSSCNMNCIQGEGPVVSADKNVDDFSRLEVSVPAEVTISIGDQYYVGIEAQQNVIEAVSAKVEGKTLVLKASPCVSTDEIFRISIIVPGLSEISINGSGSVTSKDMLVSDEMEVNINGSGDARIDLKAGEVEADINGSGDIFLSGSANEVDIEINGSGDVKALGLTTKNVRVEINGSGDVEINVSEKLTVDIAGSGNVRYSGNPKVKSSVNGSGEVSEIN